MHLALGGHGCHLGSDFISFKFCDAAQVVIVHENI
jgi:hypothetical protein